MNSNPHLELMKSTVGGFTLNETPNAILQKLIAKEIIKVNPKLGKEGSIQLIEEGLDEIEEEIEESPLIEALNEVRDELNKREWSHRRNGRWIFVGIIMVIGTFCMLAFVPNQFIKDLRAISTIFGAILAFLTVIYRLETNKVQKLKDDQNSLKLSAKLLEISRDISDEETKRIYISAATGNL